MDSSMVASNSAVSAAEKATSSARRLDTATLAAASGVRRSWLTADSRERRSSSARTTASVRLASASSRCLTKPAACLATALSTRRSRAESLRPASSIQNSSSPTSIAVSAESTVTQGSLPTQATTSLVASPAPGSRSMLTARWA